MILAGYTPAAVAARKVTSTIPIVCPLLADPIQLGLISSQSHPGGNVTGLSFRVEGLVGKHLEIAVQLYPTSLKLECLLISQIPSVAKMRKPLPNPCTSHCTGSRLAALMSSSSHFKVLLIIARKP